MTELVVDPFAPTLAAAQARVADIQPDAYARTRNAIDGAVSNLSPYITHGFVSLADVLTGVTARHALDIRHKFVLELGWREYFRHVWHHRGEGILESLHDGPIPDEAYIRELPADIQHGSTGVPVVDEAVRTLFTTGTLHNHARMWLASYVVHIRKVHWRAGADWLYGQLLDGDLASNHLSWQWIAGTGSRKPYVFNAENVARFAPAPWHSPGSVIDTSYEALESIARDASQRLSPQPLPTHHSLRESPSLNQPRLDPVPPVDLGWVSPNAAAVAGRNVWLIHPWNLGRVPSDVTPDSVVIGVCVADFHRAWPWNERRWRFVGSRMAELTDQRWHGDAATIGDALKGARTVRTVNAPHLAPWLERWARCDAPPVLFPAVDRCCDSFSQWWALASRGVQTAADLLAAREISVV